MTLKIAPELLDTNVFAMLRNTNRLINGDMRIDQRYSGGSAVVTSSSPYIVDRWTAGMSGANGTAQRVASGLLGIPFALQITGASGTTTAWIGQKIEAANAAQLVGQRITLSFYLSSSNQTSVAVNLKSANAADNFSSTTLVEAQSVTVSSTLTRYIVTFNTTMPAAVANGLYVEIVSAGNLSTGNMILTGVQLESGLYAAPFEPRHFAAELALCQRYFEKSGVTALGGTWSANNGEAAGMSHATGNFRMSIPFRVVKRVAPTFTTFDRTGTAARCSYYVAAWTDGGTLPVASAIASGAYVGHNIASSVETQFSWVSEAEL